MKLNLGFSSCPNDTYIFEAIVNNRIPLKGIEFNIHIADVEELNKKALAGELDVTKISIGAYPKIAEKYILLDSGAALGNNNGPILISKKKYAISEIENLKIAIPGFNTTANLLMSIVFPNAKNKTEVLFSSIEAEILNGNFDAGLIIHESRFTYETRGLQKIADMGEYWESTYNQLIPLGGIVIKRDLPLKIQQTVNLLIHLSLAFSSNNPEISMPFVKLHAKEMDEDVMKKHIALYVNHFSLKLGDAGREAIKFLFTRASNLGLIPPIQKDIFID